jgi:dihydropteroate synthase
MKKTKLMGILNITPDSFYDGGKYQEIDKALFQVKKMIDQGADIIDIGGESTRPGASQITEEEEIKRVIPVIEQVKKNYDITISIDTRKAKVAKLAIDMGADIINDVSGFRDENMINVAKNAKNTKLCLMHMQKDPINMQKNPKYEKGIILEISNFFQKQTNILLKAGISSDRIIIDPGIGFGKTISDNITILQNIKHFKSLGYELLLGISRKSFMKNLLRKETEELLYSTIAVNSYLISQDVDIIRVHDIEEHRDAINILSCF